MRRHKNLQRISILALVCMLVTLVFTRVQESARAEREAAAAESAALWEQLNPVEPTPELTPEPTIDPNLPIVATDSWELTLVNDLDYSNYLSSKYAPNVVSIEDRYFNDRAVEYLQDMLEDIRVYGLELYIVVGYRSYSSQEYIFNGKASQLSWDGTHTYEEAVELAKDITAFPGTSEHQLALAVDFTVNEDKITLSEDFGDTEQFKWLLEHCDDYGFIYRYPKDKTELTGRKWEPWHFRYVGRESAEYIMEHDLTLEEYVEVCRQRELTEKLQQQAANENRHFTLIDDDEEDDVD